jgi:two-component system nitrogen regulation response regulator GlnG/two-component system response regulator HydG
VSNEPTRTREGGRRPPPDQELEERLALAIVACPDPARVGEVLLIPPDAACTFGRGAGGDDDAATRLGPIRQIPGKNEARPPLDIPFLSREQLRITAKGGGLSVENTGKSALSTVSRADVKSLAVRPGDAFVVGDELVFLCVERPAKMRKPRAALDLAAHVFGEADAVGLVGESKVAWALRDNLAFLAERAAHVLLLGPSGSGKELAAQAIHRLSPRKGMRLVARNAATLPSGLIDAELFGNVANYPSHGMPERPGLVGEANGSTLFLDEIGELPEELQTRLLRFLDAHGEYQRLGDARRRTADVRVVAATNRAADALRHDVAARFKMRLTLPGLDERREDIPLLARHVLVGIARRDAEIGARFLRGWNGRDGVPSIAPTLVARLVTHTYVTHVRELDALLWRSIASSHGEELELTAEVEEALSDVPKSPENLTADDVRAALARAGGVHERAWRDLGLANRHVLKRLVKKFNLRGGDEGDEG